MSRLWTHSTRPHVAWKTRTERVFPTPPTPLYFFGRKKKIKDNDVSRTRLALRPGISNSLTGRLREDLSDGLRNYVRANTVLSPGVRGVQVAMTF